MVFAFVLAILVIVFVLAPVARSYAARVERGSGGGAALPGNSQEVARLREEVDRLGAEVARLSEEQAFMVRLLSSGEQKPSSGEGPPVG